METFTDGVFAIAATLLVLAFNPGVPIYGVTLLVAAFYLPSAALFER